MIHTINALKKLIDAIFNMAIIIEFFSLLINEVPRKYEEDN